MSPTSVDAAERQANESIIGTREELVGSLGGNLNSLRLDGGAANGHSVGTDSAGRSTAIGILDRPGCAGELLPGRALGRVKDVVVLLRSCGQAGGEDPATNV